jgi:pyrroline-5-carboxylate reductase
MWFCSGDYCLQTLVVKDTYSRIDISCKPQQAHAILSAEGVRQALDGKLLISILAGVTISQMSEWVLPTTKVIRAMPNTPARVSFVHNSLHRHR